MRTRKVLWGATILGLAVGFSALAMGQGEKGSLSSDRDVLSGKSAFFTKKVLQPSKMPADGSLIRVADEKPGAAAKNPEPLYQPPRRGAPGGRVGGGTRGPSTGLPLLFALVPDHVALTANEQPQLVWYLSKATSFPLEFTVLEGIGVEPLLEVPLPSPREPGIQILSLAQYDLKFEAGKTYQWFVSLIPDPARRSQDIVAGGMLEVDLLPEGMAKDVQQAAPLDATKLFAQAGFWYDAMEVISHGIQAKPADKALRDTRAALLEQVDLNTVAQGDRQTGL